MPASTLKLSLTAALAAAVFTAGALYLYGGMQRREARALTERNHQLQGEILARSEAQAAPRKKWVAASAHGAPASSLPSSPSPHAPTPALYRNEGQATPIATLQTFAWACDRGDVAKVAQLVVFEGSGREKAAALLAKLPEKMHGEWKTPEELAAVIYVSNFMGRPFPAANVIALATTEPTGPDRMQIRLPGSMLDKGNYLKTAEGWKFIIPEAGVDAYIAKNFKQTAQQR